MLIADMPLKLKYFDKIKKIKETEDPTQKKQKATTSKISEVHEERGFFLK